MHRDDENVFIAICDAFYWITADNRTYSSQSGLTPTSAGILNGSLDWAKVHIIYVPGRESFLVFHCIPEDA